MVFVCSSRFCVGFLSNISFGPISCQSCVFVIIYLGFFLHMFKQLIGFDVLCLMEDRCGIFVDAAGRGVTSGTN